MKIKLLNFLIIILLFSILYSSAQKSPKIKVKDGLYLISKVDTNSNQLSKLSKNETVVFFSKMFEEFNDGNYQRIIIDTTDYVPLELQKAPTTEQQTENKKKLLLSLTDKSSEKLKSFTTKNVLKHVVIVIDGEVLTMHKIKEPLTSGLLQITRCNDNACEKLFIKLKKNLKNN